MAPAVPIVVGIISALSAVYSVVQQSKAGKESKKMARDQAARQKAEAEEAKRRGEKESARKESMTRARAFASGATGQSQESYLTEMTGEHRAEADWISKAGASQASLTLKEGSMAKRQADIGAVSTAAQGVSTSASWFQQYGQ